jgi:hypothetical protein
MISSSTAPVASQGFLFEVDRTSETEWNQLLHQFCDASLYQTWAFGAETWGNDQLSHFVMKHADGRPAALAQLRLVRVPVIGGGVAYLRWGPVCVPTGGEWDPQVFTAAAQALVKEYVHHRKLVLRVIPRGFVGEPANDEARSVWESLGLQLEPDSRSYRTFRLDLAPPLDLLRKQLDQKWRNQLNGAERNGLTIREGTGDDLYAVFLSLYDSMMARKQFDTSVDVGEFRRVQARLPESQKLRILITEKEGRPMNGLVASAHGDTGIYLLGATCDEGMKTKGSYLLQWRMVQWLKERGCRWYDLGGINPETNPGVYHFKAGLSGKDVSQAGTLEFSASALSSFSLKAGETAKGILKGMRVALGR